MLLCETWAQFLPVLSNSTFEMLHYAGTSPFTLAGCTTARSLPSRTPFVTNAS